MRTELSGITVDFGTSRVLHDVHMAVEPGEIVGLLGENGAGKSTLMNVLAGALRPAAGQVLLDGRPVRLHGALDAGRHGIRFIHQELTLCNDLAVYENLYLAEELTHALLLSKREMLRRARAVFERMQVDIDPLARVEDLPASSKQLVEIARALLFGGGLIIMDEPTTMLAAHEIERLHAMMRQLVAQGVSFIYISHRMPELFAVCSRYYVLRDGRMVGQGAMAQATEASLTELMIGRSVARADAEKPSYVQPEVALAVEGLSGDGFADVSFALHRGEVLAITGLTGSGRDRLADALFGAIPSQGTVRVDGRALGRRSGILRHMRSGIAMVTRSRKERGILPDMSIVDNLSIAYLNARWRRPLISPRRERARYAAQQAALSIKADDPTLPITVLSGGNQQKVLLGRWLALDADILLLDNPTQGIDVGTKFEIYQLIEQLARQGKAIILFTSEYAEIARVCDRCMVLFAGRVSAVYARDAFDEQAIMLHSVGAKEEEHDGHTA